MAVLIVILLSIRSNRPQPIARGKGWGVDCGRMNILVEVSVAANDSPTPCPLSFSFGAKYKAGSRDEGGGLPDENVTDDCGKLEQPAAVWQDGIAQNFARGACDGLAP
jgi:hypothetical protein